MRPLRGASAARQLAPYKGGKEPGSARAVQTVRRPPRPADRSDAEAQPEDETRIALAAKRQKFEANRLRTPHGVRLDDITQSQVVHEKRDTTNLEPLVAELPRPQ